MICPNPEGGSIVHPKVTIREFNVLREGLMGVNPDLKLRPLTRYFGMKVEQLQKLFELENHLVPSSYLDLLCLVPEGKKASDVLAAVNDTLERSKTMRKNKPDAAVFQRAVDYIIQFLDKKSKQDVMARLKTENITPPVAAVAPAAAEPTPAKPRIPTPAHAPKSVASAPVDVPSRGKRITIHHNLTMHIVASFKNGVLTLEEKTPKTPAIKAGDGRVLIRPVSSDGNDWADDAVEVK